MILRCVQGMTAGLLMTLWWIPPEAAAEGDTSWRSIAWLLIAVIWSIYLSAARDTQQSSCHGWSLIDGAIALVIGGQVLGGLQVLLTVGQKRTAANLLVEWLGLAAAWWVLRGISRDLAFRYSISRMMWAAAIAAAGLGLWQHSVALPAMARDYGPRIAEARSALKTGTQSSVLRELAAAGVPTSEPGLTLFEQRLLASREPFGMFGLANTLAGLLASAIVWLLCSAFHARLPLRSRGGGVVLAGLAVMGWCLILTKSRTALLGLIVGLACWGLSKLIQRGTWRLTTRQTLGLTGLAVLVAGLPIGLVAAGVWDWQVLEEAPKSLVYRWQYWVGSARLIGEHPWLGVGLGQFRHHYLRVKLPAASEEIADPHNLWCDAWVNGGSLSVFGLLLGLYCLLKGFARTEWKPTEENAIVPQEKSGIPSNKSVAIAVVGGSLLATPLLLLAQAAFGGWDDRLLAASFVIAGVAALLMGQPQGDRTSTASNRSAGFALIPLLVHLHGAGGFEMPGVLLWVEMLLTFSIAASTPARTADVAHPPAAFRWPRLRTLGLAVLTVAIIAGLWWPGVRGRSLLEQARRLTFRNPAAAIPVLKQATAADPWNPEPWNQLAQLSRQSVDAVRGTAPNKKSALEQIDQVEQYWQAAQSRDPWNPQGWEHRAETAELRFTVSGQPDDLAQAVTHWSQAVAGYPTNSLYLANLATAAEQQGDIDLAVSAAKRALEQDDLNQHWGHRERWLPAERREQLESLRQRHTTDRPARNSTGVHGKFTRTVVTEPVGGLH